MNAYDPEEPFTGPAYQDGGHTYFHNSLIWGENLTNVSITGHGMINGGGLVSGDGNEDRDGRLLHVRPRRHAPPRPTAPVRGWATRPSP